MTRVMVHGSLGMRQFQCSCSVHCLEYLRGHGVVLGHNIASQSVPEGFALPQPCQLNSVPREELYLENRVVRGLHL